MAIELFPFRFRDPLSGKWVKARCLAERHEIAARQKEWEITGPPEVRSGDSQNYFRPYPPPVRAISSNVEREPLLGSDERYLVLLFLRRCVRYCARRRSFARMEGAARLFNRLRNGERSRG